MDSITTGDASIESLTEVIIRIFETTADETDRINLIKRIIKHQLDNFSGDDAALYRITKEILEMVGERLQDMYSRRLSSLSFVPCKSN